MSNFKLYKLSDCIEYIIDNRGKNPPLSGSGYELIETNMISSNNKYPDFNKATKYVSKEIYNSWFRKGHPKIGDILISTVGNIGKVAIINENKGCIAQNLIGLRVNNIIQPEYLYYFLIKKDTQDKLLSLNIGSVQPSIKVPHLLNLNIYVPNLKTQKECIRILGDLDQKIQLNTQINQTLEQIAQAIFKSWFVDFDPVRAKAAALESGKTQAEAELAAMQAISGKNAEELAQMASENYTELAEIAKAFPSAFGEDGVPVGWEVKRIDEVANIIKGKSYKSSELAESTTALVTLKSFNRGGGYRLDGLKEFTGKYKAEQEVFAGELIIAYTDVTQAADVIGKPAMVMSDSRYEHLVISLDVGVVRPFDEVYKYFLYCLAMTDSFQAHTKSFCTGTTVLHLGKDAVPSFEFVNPNDELLKIFCKQASPIFEKINLNIEENKSLEKTRDLLSPRLLNGDLQNINEI
ncbi:restriction endonuclease subunit S [Aggregatibacter actinomycetemcomitans]|uniref:restriction endonuclease subunit S n=1 Tax=Aggregatibacter actinomycetemcomitans TaxID=714 RepID=UPI001E4681D3|nr:restriction endonuclease subunit S [Aggregatibacter actinomycetemcomitans]